MLCADLDHQIPSRQIVTQWWKKTLQLTTGPLIFLFSLWGLENPNPSHSCFILAPLLLISAEARHHRAAKTLKRNAPHFIKTRSPNAHILGKYTSQFYFIWRLILIRTSRYVKKSICRAQVCIYPGKTEVILYPLKHPDFRLGLEYNAENKSEYLEIRLSKRQKF